MYESMKLPHLLSILVGGDLRSDGRSNEVVDQVLADPGLLPDLMKGLYVDDDVVRGRTADALEKVARIHHHLYVPYLPLLLRKARTDDVYMVRFHLAMIFGYVEVDEEMKLTIVETLTKLLHDDSVFV
jgi:hypothetical protein